MAQIQKEIVDLIRLVCNTIQPDLTDLNHPLLESGLDSLDYVSVLMAIEDKYECEKKGLVFSSVEMEKIQTVNDIVSLMKDYNIE